MFEELDYLNYLDSCGKWKKADTQSDRFFRRLAMSTSEALKILGVDDSASKDEIKSAYRKMALQFHPDVDKSENAEENFKNINRAYEILKEYTPTQSSSSYNEPAAWAKIRRQEEELKADLPKIKQRFYNEVANTDLVRELWQSKDLDDYRKHFSNLRKRRENPNFSTPKIDELVNKAELFFNDEFYEKYPTASYYPKGFLHDLDFARKNFGDFDSGIKKLVNGYFDKDLESYYGSK